MDSPGRFFDACTAQEYTARDENTFVSPFAMPRAKKWKALQRLPRGLRKHIRKEKAVVRRTFSDAKGRTEAIRALLEGVRKSP